MQSEEKKGFMMGHCDMEHMGGYSKKERKAYHLAMLEMKHKKLQAKMEFIQKVKSMVEMSPDTDDE